MAKQSFSVGQVLTAAQMTSLQQTAMGGGSPVTKTSSYVLTAADAGTVIQVNSTSATTITVNTGLFAAGDSVQIQNINSGVVTITAGTATVTTSGSLALSQWEGGFLYFTSASASIFFDYTQTGAVSPLTTKGDIWGYSTLDARIPVGANDTVLTADSTQTLGLKWATPSSGSMTLLSTTTLSGTTTTISGISGSYTDLIIIGQGFSFPNQTCTFNVNSSTTGLSLSGHYTGTFKDFNNTEFSWNLANPPAASNTSNVFVCEIKQYANASYFKAVNIYGVLTDDTAATVRSFDYGGSYRATTAVTNVQFKTTGSNWVGGQVLIYGVK